MKYAIILEQSPDTWGAYPPDIPGVGVVGDTPEEALALIDDAIALKIELLQEDGADIPVATSPVAKPLSGFAFVSGIARAVHRQIS
jgi:predicted RNase H-like HicB family nuclease